MGRRGRSLVFRPQKFQPRACVSKSELQCLNQRRTSFCQPPHNGGVAAGSRARNELRARPVRLRHMPVYGLRTTRTSQNDYAPAPKIFNLSAFKLEAVG